MPLTVGALKYALHHYPDEVQQEVAQSQNVHGFYAQYTGDGFSLSVDLINPNLVYLRTEYPTEQYRVLTGPLREFAAMLVEHHRESAANEREDA